MLRRGPSLQQFVALAFLIGVVFPFAIRDKRPDADLWWHLRTGQWIMETRAVPRVDPFSFTSSGRPWVDHAWGVQPLFYAIHERWGFHGLVLLSGFLVTLTALVLLALLYRLTGHGAPALAGITLLLAGMERYLIPRPQVFSYLCFALLLWLLVRARADRAAVRALWAAPPLMLLWANCHAGCILGLVLLGIFWLGEEWEAVRVPASASLPCRDTLRRVLPAALLGCLINPYGWHQLLLSFRHGASPILRGVVQEWRPPDLMDPRHAMAMTGGLLLLIAALGFAVERRRASDVWLALAVTAMALSSRRHIPLFLIGIAPAAAPPLGRLLGGVIDFVVSAGAQVFRCSGVRVFRYSGVRTDRTDRTGSDRSFGLNTRTPEYLNTRTPERRNTSPLLWLPLAGLLVWTWGRALPPGGAANMEAFPVGAADFLAARKLPGNMLNSYDWGGYFIYRLWPQYPVFLDGRFPTVHSEQLFLDYRTLSTAGPGWERLVDQYDLQLLVCSPLQRRLSARVARDPRWQMIYRDGQAVIYQRVDEPRLARLAGGMSRKPVTGRRRS